MTVPNIFSRYRDCLDEELHRAIRGPDLPLYTMIHYQLGWVDAHGEQEQADRGKAIRPTLCLLMCEALGGEISEALPAAAGLELLHNFSLIHDDVMDSDQTRRHRPEVGYYGGEHLRARLGRRPHGSYGRREKLRYSP